LLLSHKIAFPGFSWALTRKNTAPLPRNGSMYLSIFSRG